ncbi:MAG: glycoside hydrolase family 2 sugar binding, partial [Bacilli bacterium]|nr:glycoside hydrolase family 2 sugar binding [Bacilli bacterium]
QLTDVEQEINGLLTYDRKPKVPLEVIKQINEGKAPKI